MPALPLFAAFLVLTQPPPPPPPPVDESPKVPRGRDPWVFRCIFEDRTRMVILAPTTDLWVAFNPATCSIQKLWQGKMRFRGKVWDFSQDNCAAEGTVLAAATSLICELPDAPLPPPMPADPPPSVSHITWQAADARFDTKRMWVFDKDSASITSSAFDLSAWRRVFVAFDETSRACPFRVSVSADNGATWNAEFFDSTTSGSSDTDWQWNFKQLVTQSPTTRIKIESPRGAANKTLRHFRLFGDKPVWNARKGDQIFPLIPEWRGYTLDPLSQACILHFDLRLPDSSVIGVDEEIEASTLAANHTVTLATRFVVTGIPSTLRLMLDLPPTQAAATYRINGDAENTGLKDRSVIEFAHSGTFTITTTFDLGAHP